METNIPLKTGTAVGTLLSIIPNLHSDDIARTIVLAATGATVSFLCTLLLQVLTRTKKK